MAPNRAVANVLNDRVATDITAGLRDSIRDLYTEQHLINLYPDLYWLSVFAYCQGGWQRVVWYNEEEDEEEDRIAARVATIPTLLDNHGLVPDIDHRPEVYLRRRTHRHLPRARLDLFFQAFLDNRDFYQRYRRRLVAQQLPADLPVHREAIGSPDNLLRRDEYVLRRGVPRVTVAVLQNSLLLGEVREFTQQLSEVIYDGSIPKDPKQKPPPIRYYSAKQVQRFRLGFGLIVFDQFRQDISRVKGRAFDLSLAVHESMTQHNEQTRRHLSAVPVQEDYKIALVRLLAQSSQFVERYGRTDGFSVDFVPFLIHLGVAEPHWNWSSAIEWAFEMPHAPAGIMIRENPWVNAFNQHDPEQMQEWEFLQMISVMPPLNQVRSTHFMEAFVGSMIDHNDNHHHGRVQARIASQIMLHHSARFLRELENLNVVGPQQNMDALIDPFEVRAKVVWLLFVVPHLKELGLIPREHRDGRPDGNNVFLGPADGRIGGGGGGGQDPMQPYPDWWNPGNYDPNDVDYRMDYQDWEAETVPQHEAKNCEPASGSLSNMNGEIDGSEAKKLDEFDDPSEQSLNDSLSRLSAVA